MSRTERTPPVQRVLTTHNKLDALLERIVRIETRLSKLLIHVGLTADGHPPTERKSS